MNSIICGIITAIIAYMYMNNQNKKDKKNNIRKSLLIGLVSWFVCGKLLSLDKKNILNYNFSKVGKSCYLDDVKILYDRPDF